MILALLALFALTRAELVQRMRAPVVTQADGLVKVYASCDEDIRRDCQGPIASRAAEAVLLLYRGLGEKPKKFASPGIILRLGNGRTNDAEMVSWAETNKMRIVTRIHLKSPAYADPDRLRVEVARAFYRAVKHRELSADEALAALRAADPACQLADRRTTLERWLAEGLPPGYLTEDEFFAQTEENLRLLRKVLEPGSASRRDVLTFASRLHIYPRFFDEKFVDGRDALTFQEAIGTARKDARVRILAVFKARELPIWAGGRGEVLQYACQAYVKFLFELAKGDLPDDEIENLLEIADLKLKAAYEQAQS